MVVLALQMLQQGLRDYSSHVHEFFLAICLDSCHFVFRLMLCILFVSCSSVLLLNCCLLLCLTVCASSTFSILLLFLTLSHMIDVLITCLQNGRHLFVSCLLLYVSIAFTVEYFTEAENDIEVPVHNHIHDH